MTHWMFTLLAMVTMHTALFADHSLYSNDRDSISSTLALDMMAQNQTAPLLVMFTNTDQPEGMYWLSIPSLNPNELDESQDVVTLGADELVNGFASRDLTDWFQHQDASGLQEFSVCSLKELSRAKSWGVLVVNCHADEHRPETEPTDPPPGSGGSGGNGSGNGSGG